MATITTTTTSSPAGRHSRHSREGGNLCCRSAFTPTKHPVGANPPWRTIARSAGSYEKPDSTPGTQKTVIPAKAGIQPPSRTRSPRFARDDAFSDRSGNNHCHCEGAQRLWQSHRSGSRSRPGPTQYTPRPLRTSATSASKGHQNTSDCSADLRALRVQKSYLLITTNV